MTYAEALQWFAYVKKRGSLNVGRRIECGIALLAMMFNRSQGGKADMSDFTPHEDNGFASIDDIAAALGATRG